MKIVPMVGLVVFAILMLYSISALPFGQSPAVKEYYLKNGLDKTGSANLVNAIVWDFRGYDTLGEETILFTAVMAVILVVHNKSSFSFSNLKKKLPKTKVN